jgi:phenylacetate-coenzyme A ligase PaaK-like adenylate-forming protein
MDSCLIEFGSSSFDLFDKNLDRAPTSAGQVAVMRAFLDETFERCRYHRQRWTKQRFKTGAIESLADVSALPVLSPDDVRALPPFALLPDEYQAAVARGDLSSLPLHRRLAKHFSTSGTTGAGKSSYYTFDDWTANLAMCWRAFSAAPRGSLQRSYGGFHQGHFGGKVLEDTFARFGAPIQSRHFSVLTPQDALTQIYSGFETEGGFTALVVPPGTSAALKVQKGVTLHDLLNLDDRNYIGRQIRFILTAGGARDLPELNLRQRVWDANSLAGQPRTAFIDCYAASEVGFIAAECEQGDGLHLLPGVVHTEVLHEATGEACGNGERGLITVTAMRHGSRFIRYRVGDEATLISDPCACGRTTHRLKNIVRVLDKERLNSGCGAA